MKEEPDLSWLYAGVARAMPECVTCIIEGECVHDDE